MSSVFSRKITMLTRSGCLTGDGPPADVKVEHLAQGHVERPDAAADRGRQGALDPDDELPERLHRVVRKPVVEPLEAFLAGVHLEPRYPAPARIGLLHRGLEDAHGRGPDVGTRAVAPDEGDDRIVRYVELGGPGDFPACGRGNVFVGHELDSWGLGRRLNA